MATEVTPDCRIVSIAVAGGLASPIQQYSDGAQGGSWHETGPAIAYSAISQRFMVAWRTNAYGIHGRSVARHDPPVRRARRVDVRGHPVRTALDGDGCFVQHLSGFLERCS